MFFLKKGKAIEMLLEIAGALALAIAGYFLMIIVFCL
jgi:hypothetical protein